MYDKPIKWIHLGLQESSLINSDIYRHGLDASVSPPVQHRAGTAYVPDAVRGVVCFPVLQRGAEQSWPPVQAPLSLDWFLCPFNSSKGRERKPKLDTCAEILQD